MRHLAPAATLVVALAVAPVAAAVATPGEVAPPVEELVAVALARAPSVAALRERLAAAREMVAAAGALPDPMAELVLQDAAFPDWSLGDSEMSMVGPEVSQRLPYPGKREARRQAARAEVAVRAEGLEALRRALATEVRAAYARIWALDRERAALGAAAELLDLLAVTAAARYGVGEAEQEAVVRAMLEASRLAERRDDLEAERKGLVAGLDRLLDRPGDEPFGEVEELPPVAAPAAGWQGAAVAGAAEVAVRRAEVAAAERRLDVARLDLRPDFTTGAGVGLRADLDPVVTLRFGVEWPLWRRDRQQPVVRAAEHELEAARAELRDAEARARAEAARLTAEWERAERQVRRYREAILPQTSAAVDAARASYLAGRGDFSTVVEGFRLWLDARTELARREADRFRAWAELAALVGEGGTEPGAGEEE